MKTLVYTLTILIAVCAGCERRQSCAECGHYMSRETARYMPDDEGNKIAFCKEHAPGISVDYGIKNNGKWFFFRNVNVGVERDGSLMPHEFHIQVNAVGNSVAVIANSACLQVSRLTNVTVAIPECQRPHNTVILVPSTNWLAHGPYVTNAIITNIVSDGRWR
jgi:hypothetical protein